MSDEKTGEKEYSFAPKRRASLGLRLGLGALLLAGTAIIAYPLVQGSGITSAVETSKADDFQDQVDGDGFGRMTVDAEPTEQRSEPRFDPGPIEDELAAQRKALEEQNAKLASDVVALQAQLARLAEAPAPDNSAELAEALRSGNMGVMDLYRLRNIDSDTQMRRSISDGDATPPKGGDSE